MYLVLRAFLKGFSFKGNVDINIKKFRFKGTIMKKIKTHIPSFKGLF
jgi:hypothetical protein